jgi:hypothetical protein
MKKNISLVDLTNAGFLVDVTHRRRYKTATLVNGKIVISRAKLSFSRPDQTLTELLPKGGTTTVKVLDTVSGTTFVGTARCHAKENFCCKSGREKALADVLCLMEVSDGKDGFNVPTRLQ